MRSRPSAVAAVSGVARGRAARRETRPEGYIETFYRGTQARLPGLRQLLPARYDVLGRPIPQQARAAFDPTLATQARELTDPVIRELIRNEVTIGSPNRRAGEPEEEYQVRRRFGGRLIELELLTAIDSPAYQQAATPEERRDLLNQAIRAARADLSSYTTRDEQYERETTTQRIRRLEDYIGLVDSDIRRFQQSGSVLPPVPTLESVP